ncbi:hypothetical protein A8U91_04424 [Halomonas elongata]|uniref:Uncharacterized protein n=1 Tax=Halomonas elongata TaxID=2746 RepID=A0A1B8NZD3_HALEL|nr:hypothetical protein A8U91_04424 [Halomonas elongata]
MPGDRVRRAAKGAVTLDAQAHLAQTQLMGEQFLQGQATSGGVLTFGQCLGIGIRRRTMQSLQAFVQRRKRETLAQGVRQPFRQLVGRGVEAGQRLADQGAQPGLMQPSVVG